MKKKLVVLVVLTLICCSNVFGQKKVILKVSSFNIPFQHDTTYLIDVLIENHYYSKIQVPLTPIVLQWGYAGVNDLGISMKLMGRQKITGGCPSSAQYLVAPTVVELKKGEKRSIKANLEGSCFGKKGRYKVRFYLVVQKGLDDGETLRYSSKKIIIKVL